MLNIYVYIYFITIFYYRNKTLDLRGFKLTILKHTRRQLRAQSLYMWSNKIRIAAKYVRKYARDFLRRTRVYSAQFGR